MSKNELKSELFGLQLEAEQLASLATAIQVAMEFGNHAESTYTSGLFLLSLLMEKHAEKLQTLESVEVAA